MVILLTLGKIQQAQRPIFWTVLVGGFLHEKNTEKISFPLLLTPKYVDLELKYRTHRMKCREKLASVLCRLGDCLTAMLFQIAPT